MLRIRVVAIGDFKNRWIADGCEHYTKLLSRWANVEFVCLPSPKGIYSLPPLQIMEREAERIEKELGKGTAVALSDKGKRLNSLEFAEVVRRFEMTSSGVVTYLIGGPYGLAQRLMDRADHVCSLSPLTFSHQLARIVLLEQLYRAYSLIHHTDYHK